MFFILRAFQLMLKLKWIKNHCNDEMNGTFANKWSAVRWKRKNSKMLYISVSVKFYEKYIGIWIQLNTMRHLDKHNFILKLYTFIPALWHSKRMKLFVKFISGMFCHYGKMSNSTGGNISLWGGTHAKWKLIFVRRDETVRKEWKLLRKYRLS